MIDIARLCTRIIRLIHTPVRVYDEAGKSISVYVDNNEQQDPLACDEVLLRNLLYQRRLDCPNLYLDGNDIIYGIIWNGENTYILGPCCLGRDPVAAARRLVRQHGMDRKRPYRIPFTALTDFSEVLLSLFECLTGIMMDASELYLRTLCDQKFEQGLYEKVQQVFYTLQENKAVHNPYSQELMEQDSIRTGDLEGLYRSFQIPYVGEVGRLSKDPLRWTKNMAVVVTTLASRSAIQGGLLPELAFSMSDAFIQHAEELNSVGEVYTLIRQIEVEYCQAVAKLTKNTTQSTLITRCKGLIAQRLHSRLMIKELAEELGVSRKYLTQLFLKEEGMPPTDYILQEKIRDAKSQLAYGGHSYEAIALSLGFASQSHFGQVFKKQTGLTPKQYRENYRQSQEKSNSSK